MKTKRVMVLGIILLLTFSLILSLGCNKETETATEFKTLLKYGFSFQYPINFNVDERGLIDNEVNDNSGVVEVVYKNENVQVFQVTYLKALQWSNLDAVPSLEAWIKKENITSMEIAER